MALYSLIVLMCCYAVKKLLTHSLLYDEDRVEAYNSWHSVFNICCLFSAAERQRPYLMTRVQGTNDYINAAFLDVSVDWCLVS